MSDSQPIAEIVAELRRKAESHHTLALDRDCLRRLLDELERLQREVELYKAMKSGVSVRIANLEAELARARRIEQVQRERKWGVAWGGVEWYACRWASVAGCLSPVSLDGVHFTHPTDPGQPLLDAAAYFEERGK